MKSRWTLLGSILAVLMLALVAGLTQAQSPELLGEGVHPQGVGMQAAVGAVIPIQGRLTDASGNPLNGNYSITASIYNVSSGGTALCSDTETVAVSNGLFTMNVDNCTSDSINGQQLYLGVKVGSDNEMSPRQPIYPVPYAMSLMPGAKISYIPLVWSGTYVNLQGNLGNPISWYLGYSFPLVPSGRAYYGMKAEASGGNEAYGVSGHAETSADNSKAYGVYGSANATGSGSESYGVYGVNESTRGGSHGVYGWTNGDWGWASGVYGEADKDHAHGVTGWNTGAGIGVYGHSESGIGVYSESTTGVAIKADGTGIIQSTAVSRVFVPGGEAVVGGTATSDVQLTYWGQGRVEVKTTSSNVTRTLVIPLPLPAVLYGQQVRIADIRVYYKTSNSASYIAETDVYREQIGGSFYSLIENKTHRTSTTDTYYYLSCTDANCRLSDDEGFVSVRLQLYFNSNAHTITIGGVRVTLEHD